MRTKSKSLLAVLALACLGTAALSGVTGMPTNEKTVKAEGKKYEVNYDFAIDADTRLADFDSYYWEYDPNNALYCLDTNPYGNGYYQAQVNHADAWTFTDRGLAGKHNMSYSLDWLNNNSWLDNWSSLLAKTAQTYFTIETTLSFSEGKYNAGNVLFPGYGGVQFNVTDPIQAAVFLRGIAVYIDANSGAVIYRNSGAAHAVEHTDVYDAAEYGGVAYNRMADHTLKVEVSETGFKAYVNDVLRLDVANATLVAEGTPIVEGRVGLVSVAVDCYYKNLSITPANGEKTSYGFVVEDAYEGFDAYYFNYMSGYGVDAWTQVQMAESKLWGKTSKGMSRLKSADKLAPDTDGSWKDMNNLNSYLYTGKTYRYFEAETDITFDTLATTGSAGLQFGADRMDRPVYWTKGFAAYINSADGSVTLRSHLGDTANGEIRETDAYDAAEYGGVAFDKKATHNLYVKADKEGVEVYVNGVMRIDYAYTSIAGYELGMGVVGLYGDSNTSFFKNLKINALSGDGNVVVLPESVSVGEIENAKVGGSYELPLTFAPSNATRDHTVEITGDAVYSDGVITFLKAGKVTVSVKSSLEETVTASKTFDVTLGTETSFYDLSKTEDTAKLLPYFKNDNSLSAVSGVSDILSNHWSQGANGLTRIAATGDNKAVDSNYAMLYLPGIYKDFEAVFTFNDNNVALGWAGLMFGKETYGSSQYSNGNAVNLPIQFAGYSCHGTQLGTAADENNEQGNYPLYLRGQDNVLKVRVYGDRFELYFNNLAKPVINKEVVEAKDGFVALYATLEGEAQSSVTFKTVALTMLGEDGERINYQKSEAIAWENQNVVYDAYTATVLTATVGGTQKFVNYKSDNEDVVYIVNGNTAYFVGEGEANVTAFHVDGCTTVTKKFTSVKRAVQGARGYAFDEEISKIETWYQSGEEAGSAQKEELGAHWSLDGDVLTRVNDVGGGVVSVAWSNIYLDRTYQNFEISFNLKAGCENAGWVGVMFGKTTKNSSFFYDGDGAYLSVQDSEAKFWGTTVGNHSDKGNSAIAKAYNPYGWNTYKLKVFGGVGSRTAQLFVNDMETPVVTNTKAVAPKDGYISLFATAVTASFKDVQVRYLSEAGEVISYVAANSLTISNKITTANVGQKHTLTLELLPLDTTLSGVIYETSDRSVAIVNGQGEINFINPGEVTISVKAKDNTELTDSMTIVCRQAIEAVTITNKISAANVGDTHVLLVKDDPNAASHSGMKYSSSDETIATVDNGGKIVFLKEGTVTITATSTVDETKSDSMTVKVSAKKEDKNEDKKESSGCGSSTVAFAALSACAVVAVFGLKKKEDK